ncbi:PACE efflux transporter [Vibrio sp. SCSIO 43137]|uniref:PACE efflux transporter n=1 Tax=Vibrio sp. SCSIO 43137 TaxID=3021011 RepID=UPI0023082DE3|nr:PACE efflux transporter [Vibrio sp. SCSIO 43137]WCE31430.1 PACE efflux transporter [Vibrio sp. SCSIO 43137]
MRTKGDRVRHAVGFEIIGLLLVVIIGSSLLGIEAQKLGVLGVSMSLLATGWNYVFNFLFDHWLLRRTGRLNKSFPERVIHACLFEGSLVVLSVPIIAWYLEMTLMNAFMMDLGLTLFYLLYTFIYNWLYDKLFPIPVTKEQT